MKRPLRSIGGEGDLVVRIRPGAGLTVAALVLATLSVHAGPAPCTAAPGAPDSVAATVVAATRATRPGEPSTPAILELVWTPARVGPGQTADAPTGYVIEAGTARGASDVAVVETDGGELAYSTPMPNGTFYVRVKARNACGTSSPSPDAVARVRGSVASGRPNPVVLMKTVRVVRERLASRDFVRVLGQVRNGWRASDASFIEVTATFEGPGGQAVGTRSTYVNGNSRRLTSSRIVTDTVLGPAATGCFVTFADFPAADRVGSVGLVVTSSDSYRTAPLAGRVEVEGPVLQQADAFGDLVVSGQLKNRGDSPTYFNEIWTEVRDAEGKVLDCDGRVVNGSRVVSEGGIATHTGLGPAVAAGFGNVTEAVMATASRLRHWITWDENGEPGPAPPTPRHRALRERLATVLEADEQAAPPPDRMDARDALRREVRALEQRLR